MTCMLPYTRFYIHKILYTQGMVSGVVANMFFFFFFFFFFIKKNKKKQKNWSGPKYQYGIIFRT